MNVKAKPDVNPYKNKYRTICSRNDSKLYYVKSVRIRSYSDPQFPTFGLNMERCYVSLRIQFEYRKIPNRITANTEAFYAVLR